LAQFEAFDVVFVHDGDAEDVTGGEDPATATTALVGDLFPVSVSDASYEAVPYERTGVPS
jgi:hypothetical protein